MYWPPTSINSRQRRDRLACAQVNFLIHLVVCLESHLLRRTNSEPHKCVYFSQIDINVECFTWAELANITGRMVQRMAMAGEHRGFITSVFRTQSVQIIVHMLLSTVGNWYICNERAQQRPRMISSHATTLQGHFTSFCEESLHKHPHGWSHSWCGSLSCVECCT